jgi:type II secretory pathway component PulM
MTATSNTPVIKSVAREYSNDDYEGYNDQYLGAWDIKKDLTAKGTAEAGSLVEVQWGSATHQVLVQSDGTWATVFNPSEVPADGTTTLSAKVTDKAGNTSVVQRHLVVDTERPADATIDPLTGDNVINAKEKAAGLTVTGTAEANGYVLVIIPSTPYSSAMPFKTVAVDATGHWSVHFNSNEVPSGAHNIWATAFDEAYNPQSGQAFTTQNFTYDTEVAGTVSAVSSQAVKVDTVVAAPVINTVAVDNMVNATEKQQGVTVTGIAEAGSAVNVSLGNTEHAVKADNHGAWSSTFASADILADGYSAITAIATDVAGNVSAVSSRAMKVDTVVDAPVINTVAVDNMVNAAEKQDGVTVTGMAEAGSAVNVSWGNTEHAVKADDHGAWSSTFTGTEMQADILADGYNAITAIAIDVAGNVSAITSHAMKVDTVVDAPVINTVAVDNMVNAAEKQDGVTVTGMAEAGSAVSVSWGNTEHAVKADNHGAWSSTFSGTEMQADILADGYNAITAIATDVAGNVSAITSRAMKVDTVVDAPVINTVAVDNIVNAAEKRDGVTVTGTAEAGSAVNVSWGNTEHAVKADNQGAWSSTFVSADILADGYSAITAIATDVAGNVSALSSHAVKVDTVMTAPSINTVAADPMANTAQTSLVTSNFTPEQVYSNTGMVISG